MIFWVFSNIFQAFQIFHDPKNCYVFLRNLTIPKFYKNMSQDLVVIFPDILVSLRSSTISKFQKIAEGLKRSLKGQDLAKLCGILHKNLIQGMSTLVVFLNNQLFSVFILKYNPEITTEQKFKQRLEQDIFFSKVDTNKLPLG